MNGMQGTALKELHKEGQLFPLAHVQFITRAQITAR